MNEVFVKLAERTGQLSPVETRARSGIGLLALRELRRSDRETAELLTAAFGHHTRPMAHWLTVPQISFSQETAVQLISQGRTQEVRRSLTNLAYGSANA